MEQNQFASKADVDVINNQLDQLVEAMATLERRDDSVQRTIVIENIIPPQYHSFAFSVQNSQGAVPVTKIKDPRDVAVAERFQVLEEKLKAIEGHDAFGLNASDMCLVPGLIMPPKFKTPNFEKYKGDSCPKNHLVMFCRKMTSYARNDKLMIHYFQDSLGGASLSWYMQLEKCHIQSWLDLANAFLKQYHYNLDMAPSRMQLQGLSQESNEFFRGYAQRWRELAAQVQPPLLEKELVDLFMDTLQGPYYKKMIGSTAPDFSHLVSAGIRIESMLKSGKIQDVSNIQASESESLVSSQEQEEMEINAI
ncbi:uncharacterized protein LOC127079559 [Lathyrus oleraceus]|uniref:uncharacterized protein LOC127079559 n=1 Tax=Pisum sativum TaxID=3888 RepID=UPI0021CFC69A|nr:uncharacterized protein LOC127079559 [Pisum sativum]